MHRTVLIDADGLVYHSSKESIMESIGIMDEKINNIFDKTGATHYMMFISQGKYFRHDVYPEYKASRRSPTHLLWISALKGYLMDRWGAIYMPKVEADDLLVWYYNRFKTAAPDADSMSCEYIISSPDKDILQRMPGKHFNYTYRLEDKENTDSLIRGWWVETSKDDAKRFKFYQLIVGDSSDGVKGIDGKGEEYFERLGSWNFCKVLQAYQVRYGDKEGLLELIKNFRLLHILEDDSDFTREVGRIPELVTPVPVPITIPEDDDFDIDETLL